MLTKPCPICGGPVPATHALRVTCSMKCRRVWQSRLWKGKAPAPVVTAARRAQSKQAVRDRVRQRFGELTDREILIFQYGVKVGYRNGWARAEKWARNSAA